MFSEFSGLTVSLLTGLLSSWAEVYPEKEFGLYFEGNREPLKVFSKSMTRFGEKNGEGFDIPVLQGFE